MRYLVFTFITVLFLLTSCTKDKLTFVIKGTVTAAHDQSVVKEATVKLFATNLGSMGNNISEETITDGNGNFEFKIERERFEKIRLTCLKEDFFDYQVEVAIDNLSNTEPNIIDAVLVAKAWSYIHVKNSISGNQSDEMKIQKVSGKENCSECCDNGFYFFNGVVDDTLKCMNEGGTYLKFYFWLNGNQIYGLDSIYCTPFEEVTYELFY